MKYDGSFKELVYINKPAKCNYSDYFRIKLVS